MPSKAPNAEQGTHIRAPLLIIDDPSPRSKCKSKGDKVKGPTRDRQTDLSRRKLPAGTKVRNGQHWSDGNISIAFFFFRKRISVVMSYRKATNTKGCPLLPILRSFVRIGQSTKNIWHNTKAWKLHKELYKIRGAHNDVAQRWLHSNSRTSKCIDVETEHKVERQDELCRQRCFTTCGGMFFSRIHQRKRKPSERQKISHMEIQTASSSNEAEVHTRELDTYFYVKLVGDSLSVLSLGRLR